LSQTVGSGWWSPLETDEESAAAFTVTDAIRERVETATGGTGLLLGATTAIQEIGK
jgi:hypothetical protein